MFYHSVLKVKWYNISIKVNIDVNVRVLEPRKRHYFDIGIVRVLVAKS